VCISYPLPGDHFLLTPPAGTLEVTVQALCRAPLPHLTWLVNGREVGTVGPPYTLTLSLPRGRHQLTALGPDNLGNSIDILVQ
jgi:hypothetical protein